MFITINTKDNNFAILFNKTCLNENILRKFTNIYIYNVIPKNVIYFLTILHKGVKPLLFYPGIYTYEWQ